MLMVYADVARSILCIQHSAGLCILCGAVPLMSPAHNVTIKNEQNMNFILLNLLSLCPDNGQHLRGEIIAVLEFRMEKCSQ